MKCNEIENALNGDMAELKAASLHIENCAACRETFASDLEMEYALRGMAIDDEPINIIPALNKELSLEVRRRYFLGFAHGWVWLAAAVAVIGIVFINLETITSLLNSGYTSLLEFLSGYQSTQSADLHKLSQTIKSSSYYEYIILAVFMAAITVIGYLWREFKEIIR